MLGESVVLLSLANTRLYSLSPLHQAFAGFLKGNSAIIVVAVGVDQESLPKNFSLFLTQCRGAIYCNHFVPNFSSRFRITRCIVLSHTQGLDCLSPTC
jgi:hypothetical protein